MIASMCTHRKLGRKQICGKNYIITASYHGSVKDARASVVGALFPLQRAAVA
jgi:hypothetical protein